MRAIKTNGRTLTIASALLCLGLLLSGCGAASGNGNLQAGEKYQAEGKYRAAYIEAKKVLQRDSKSGGAWLLLGQASLMLGKPTDALNNLQHARDNGVPKAQWVVPTAQALRASHQFDKLLKTISTDKLKDPDTKGRVYVLRGDAFLGMNLLEQAKQSYQDAVALDPNNAGALSGLAMVSATDGHPDAASAYVQKALAASPDNPKTWMIKGDIAFNRHDFAGAESDYQKALGFKHPDWLPQDRFYTTTRLANAQAQQRQYDKALDNVELLEKMSPQQPYPHYLHAAILYEQGHLDQAVSELQQVLKTQPNNPQAQFLMGAVNYAQSNYSQAEMYFSNVLGMDQKNAQAHRFLALTLYRSGRSSQALEALRPAVPGKPSDTQLMAMLQRAVANGIGQPGTRGPGKGETLASGDKSEAIRLLESMPAGAASTASAKIAMQVLGDLNKHRIKEALDTASSYATKHPKDSSAHLLYATALVVAGKHTQARAQYTEAHKLDPNNLAALLSLGNLDAMEGHVKEATGHYETVLTKDPKNVQAMNALGRLDLQQGNRSDATSRFKQAIEAAPKNPAAYLSLMVIYSQGGQNDEAVKTAQRLVKALPGNPAALNALGAVELNAGHQDKALEPLQKAVKLAPKVPLYRINLARAQIINKDTKHARDNLSQVVRAHPGQVEAVTLLAFMKLQEHDLPGALSLAQALQNHAPAKAAGLTLEGDLYTADKSWKKAARAYQQGLKIAYERPLVIKYFLALSKGTSKDPEHVLQDWLSKHPDDAAMRLVLGQYYIDHDHNDKASVQYKRVLKAYPANISALNNLAWIYTEQRNPEGLVLAEKAYKLAPQSPYIADTYGWALIAGNKPKQALPVLQKAAKAVPHAADIHYHLAVAQAHTGDTAGARATLEPLMKPDVDFQDKGAAEKLYRTLGSTEAGGSSE